MKGSVYQNSISFKVGMTLVAGVSLYAAVASGSVFLVVLVGVALTGYIFYRVLTDRVKP
jgi:hypothetical protein